MKKKKHNESEATMYAKLNAPLKKLGIKGEIKPNAVNIMSFAHDDWCNLPEDMSKDCICEPDVSVAPWIGSANP